MQIMEKNARAFLSRLWRASWEKKEISGKANFVIIWCNKVRYSNSEKLFCRKYTQAVDMNGLEPVNAAVNAHLLSLADDARIYYVTLYLHLFVMNSSITLNGFRMNLQKANSLSIMFMRVAKNSTVVEAFIRYIRKHELC